MVRRLYPWVLLTLAASQIYNYAEDTFTMALPSGNNGNSVTIPSVLIAQSHGESLKNQASLVATSISLGC